ncbi:antibiotic biosynthesis monooxygenase family protein [Peribacillus sp. NPDC058002]|uniref:antibiotic biosynthesis monooxygenase family protein n=1 Tax=Peribacillus sp. NPDC058002 TaxID=3346301 RepID=UPI0036D940CB
MVIEHARMVIKEELVEEFLQTINRASSILINANGYISHELLKNKENQTLFILVVHWSSLEDHVEGFVKSNNFLKWESMLNRYFSSVPEVLHFTEIKCD